MCARLIRSVTANLMPDTAVRTHAPELLRYSSLLLMPSDSERPPQPGTITKMDIQTHDEDRMSIFLDGTFAFGLHQDIVVKHGLSTGQTLSVEEQRTLIDTDRIVRAKQRALDYLAYKPRTTEEVRRKLRKKEIPRAIIDTVIDQLTERGYLDDDEYARMYVQRRFSHKGYGPVRLQAELQKRGIDRPLAETAVEELFAEEDQLDAARRQAEARWPRITRRKDDPRKRRDSLYRYLKRRGFTYDVIREVIDEVEARTA